MYLLPVYYSQYSSSVTLVRRHCKDNTNQNLSVKILLKSYMRIRLARYYSMVLCITILC